MLFAELTYTLATEEAERIGVDHVARMTATGTGENSTGKEGSVFLSLSLSDIRHPQRLADLRAVDAAHGRFLPLLGTRCCTSMTLLFKMTSDVITVVNYQAGETEQ